MEGYQRFKVTGPVSVVEVANSVPVASFRILLLGTTGSGKSTFVESCAEIKTLSISRNSLESVTQTVTAYRLVNVQSWVGEAIYLVDTPGFMDHKVSEMKIVKLIQDWLHNNHLPFFHRVLFMDAITNIRMSCSRKTTLNMVKSLTGWKSARSITLVTTHWDSIWNTVQKEKANVRFEQLRDEHWKDFTSEGTKMCKFMATQSSTLSILDTCMSDDSGTFFHFEPRALAHLSTPSYPALTYQSLLDRISRLQKRMSNIQDEMQEENAGDDEVLLKELVMEMTTVQLQLRQFEQELQEFGGPPPGFVEGKPQSIRGRPAAVHPNLSFDLQAAQRADSLDLWHCDTPPHIPTPLVDSPQRSSFFEADHHGLNSLTKLTFRRNRR